MASTFIKIASMATDGSTKDYTFSSIPQTYKDLVLIAEYSISLGTSSVNLLIGGQTQYSYERSTSSDASNPVSTNSALAAAPELLSAVNSNSSKNAIKIDFINYANASNRPSFISIGYVQNSNTVTTVTGNGTTVGAISQITISSSNSPGNGLFTLYGVS